MEPQQNVSTLKPPKLTTPTDVFKIHQLFTQEIKTTLLFLYFGQSQS